AVGSQMVFTYIHRAALGESATFVGAERTLAAVRRAGEPYTFGFDPAELPQYLAARDLILIEDVDASTYRGRYLRPLGREQEPLAEFQRAAVVEVAGEAWRKGGVEEARASSGRRGAYPWLSCRVAPSRCSTLTSRTAPSSRDTCGSSTRRC